jgi:chromosome condensin MukBEF ATPase and DNA-binding subunit MukB
VAEAHLDLHLDASLDRAVNNPARRTLSATSELVEVAKAVNRLRQSKGIKYLVPAHLQRRIQTSAGNKRKYDELLDRTEREAQLRAAAKRVNDMFRREERTKRRDGLKVLHNELDKKTQDLAMSRSSLRKERMEVKRLEQSLECQICRDEPWDTATGCGHLFGAECIKQ